MYVRRIKGAHAVTLPDGSQMTRADLPDRRTRRWVASRKAAVVKAVTYGLITAEEAVATYGLSAEELAGWTVAVARYGEGALKATALQRYRE